MLNCSNLETVEDITSQCEYEDTKPDDKRDRVSCCQDNGYNELKNKLKTYSSKYPKVSETDILKAMCECCNQVNQQSRTHEIFNGCIDKILS